MKAWTKCWVAPGIKLVYNMTSFNENYSSTIIAELTVNNGNWNWNWFQSILPQDVLSRLQVVYPPQDASDIYVYLWRGAEN